MEEGLFKKYKQTVSKREEEKKKIINLIYEACGILLSEDELQVSKRKVIISTSSVKKAKLTQHRIHTILNQGGYVLT